MTNDRASRALDEFIADLDELQRVAPEVRELVRQLHGEGSLSTDALVDGLRAARRQDGEDDAHTPD